MVIGEKRMKKQQWELRVTKITKQYKLQKTDALNIKSEAFRCSLNHRSKFWYSTSWLNPSLSSLSWQYYNYPSQKRFQITTKTKDTKSSTLTTWPCNFLQAKVELHETPKHNKRKSSTIIKQKWNKKRREWRKKKSSRRIGLKCMEELKESA